MKSMILATLIASAAAFAPSKTATTSSALQASFENEIGAQPPLGFWDPMGLATDQESFDRLRYVELKHGRVAMLAVVGYLTTYLGVRFPGAEDIPCGFAAINAVPMGVWVQFAFTVGVMEAFNRDASDIWPEVTGPSEFPGDFRNDFLDFGWDKKSDAWKTNKRAIELNNGRAAQMGIWGLMVHEQLGNVDQIIPFAK